MGYQKEFVLRPSLGKINVIFAAPDRIGVYPSGFMSIARPDTEDRVLESKQGRLEAQPTSGFFDEDKIETYQLYDDVLVVILRIGGYDVKRVLVDQGSGTEIMYPDLYNGLNLRLEDLVSYDSPLVGFDRKAVIPKGLIKLHV